MQPDHEPGKTRAPKVARKASRSFTKHELEEARAGDVKVESPSNCENLALPGGDQKQPIIVRHYQTRPQSKSYNWITN